MTTKTALMAIITATSVSSTSYAESNTEVVVQAGLLQPVLLQGGNVEVDFNYKRFVLGYSHGFGLKLEGKYIVGEAKTQGLAYTLPFTTGVGVGYRVLDWLDVRAEAKWHKFEVHYDDSRNIEGGELFSYTTITLGAGVYGHWRPFGSRKDWLRGFNLSTSLRYWPNVATSLDSDKREYDNDFIGQRVTHNAANIGIANTPIIVNMSVGYAFKL